MGKRWKRLWRDRSGEGYVDMVVLVLCGMLVLALCVLVSYCGVQAILIDLLAKLLKGLFGYGYWLAGPAMLLAGGILLLHRGRPVTLRATCALLLPLLAGALFHTIFAGGDYALNGWGVLKNLWTAGLALKAGGAVSGLLAEAAVLAVSKVVSLFLFGWRFCCWRPCM